MAFWKQLLLSIVVLAAAAFAWVNFFPGAPAILARWGIDWAPVATANTPAAETASESGPAGASAGLPDIGVVTEPIANGTINDRLTAIGTGRANGSVSVRPFDSGRLTELLVSSGEQVSAGDVIARLDSEAEQIAFDRARIALEDANGTLERMRALRETNTASAVQVTEAELAQRNAELALREAELALERRAVSAPISGVIGILPITAGNYVTSETEIATIEDRSRILVDFWAPERFAAQIRVGAQLTATSIARPGESFTGTVSAVDNRIDAESRTLRVQAQITNTGDTLRAGMSFQVTMRFAGDTYPAVDPLAVQWGADGAFVWTVREGRAVRTPVRIVQRNTESILVDAQFQDEDMVVVQGIHAVREGAPVMVARQNNLPRPADPQAPAATASGT